LKLLNFVEWNSYVFWIEQMLLGAQLQDVWTNDRYFVLEFYKFRNLWLVCDLDVSHPQLILIQKETPPILKRPKPVGLFVASHARNLRVEFFKILPEGGRVAEIQVSGRDQICLIEMRMVPTAVNIVVTSRELNSKRAKEKKVSWDKLKELPQIPHPTSEITSGLEAEWLAREEEWWEEQRKKRAINKVDGSTLQQKPKTDFAKVKAKKQKALETLQAGLEGFEDKSWLQLGEALKTPGDYSELPAELQELVNNRISRSENMAMAFKKDKDLHRKKVGALERIEKLKLEVAKLESSSAEIKFERQQHVKSSGSKSLQKADARGRKLSLAPGLEAICGRSARDNLAILRQARAWDLWLHLKDYPGAHAIIFRDKNKVVDLATIEKVSEWVIRESPAAKGFSWGVKYDVVVVETRYVKPIKGDKVGRVTYQNPKVFTFSSQRA
jgi:predicted ribosome quality control (RQC) complex YloA/Tae2 family protein